MTSLNNAQKKVIIIGVFILLLVIIGGGFLLFYKPNETTEEPLLDNETIKEIEPLEAEEMYDTLTEECQGEDRRGGCELRLRAGRHRGSPPRDPPCGARGDHRHRGPLRRR